MHDEIERHKSAVPALVTAFNPDSSVSDPADVKEFFQWFVREKLRVDTTMNLETTFSNVCVHCRGESGQNTVAGSFVNVFGIQSQDLTAFNFQSHIPALLDQRNTDVNYLVECPHCLKMYAQIF